MNEPAILVESLVKDFRRGPRGQGGIRAVDHLSFTVQGGQIFGLLGPNGAGKTTTLKVLTTVLRPDQGRAEVRGFDVATRPLEVRRSISVVLQQTAVEMFLTVRDNLLTYARFYGVGRAAAERKADEVMERFDIRSEADRKVQDLSGGYRRRVQVGKIFLVDTPVVFLDEFSTGMDPILKREVMGCLREEAARGRTIVLTTQVLSEAEELCDDILILNRGRSVARGDLHTLKLLSRDVYDVSMTFAALPDSLVLDLEALKPLRTRINQTTIELSLRAPESRVLEIVSDLARKGQLLRVEIGGATLEDIFIEVTRDPALEAR